MYDFIPVALSFSIPLQPHFSYSWIVIQSLDFYYSLPYS